MNVLEQAAEIVDGGADEILTLWHEVARIARHRLVDPDLREDLIRILVMLPADLADQIRADLDVAVPEVVLNAYRSELVTAGLNYYAAQRSVLVSA